MASSPPNNDVVTKILLHLPILPLFRFRTVCKFWRDVIDSPLFQKSHIRHNVNNNDDDEDDTQVLLQFQYAEDRYSISKSSIMLLDTGKSSYDDFPALRELGHLETAPGRIVTESKIGNVRVAGPVNGPVCIYTRATNGDIAVCNPSSGQIKMLPVNPVLCPLSRSRDVGICFDDVAHDYRVVQLMSCDEHRRLHASVYSGATGSWTELGGDGDGQYLRIVEPVKSSRRNGAVSLWRAVRVVGEEDIDDEDIILSFDVKSGAFRSLDMPSYGSMGSFGDVEIFAKGETFVLVNSVTVSLVNSVTVSYLWLYIYEARFERNDSKKNYTLRWDFVKKVGPFDGGAAVVKAMWRSDCMVLIQWDFNRVVYNQWGWNQFLSKVVFYDYCDDKIIRSFEMPDCCNSSNVFEYQGSFVSP